MGALDTAEAADEVAMDAALEAAEAEAEALDGALDALDAASDADSSNSTEVSSSSVSDSSSEFMEVDLSGEDSELDEQLDISDMPVICWAEGSFRANHS